MPERPLSTAPSPAATSPLTSARSGGVIGGLVALVAGLLIALFLAPSRLAGATGGERNQLAGSARKAFAEYWAGGQKQFPPSLAALVDYWRRFHIAKAVIAAALLIACLALAVVVWPSVLRRTTRSLGGAAMAFGGVAASGLAVLAGLTLMANIQGIAQPFSSLLSMLPSADGTSFANTQHQVAQRLADSASARTDKPLAVMIDDFARYHQVLALMAGILAAGLAAGAVISWRRRASSAAGSRMVGTAYSVLAGLFALAAAVICVANITVAAHPVPALQDVFQATS